MNIKEVKIHVKVGSTLICMIDEYGQGKESQDCYVKSMNNKGVRIRYLNDNLKDKHGFVSWKDIVAKEDRRKPLVSVARYHGTFIVFREDLKHALQECAA